MEAISLEMLPLVSEDDKQEINETKMYMQELPSRLARHTTSTVMRNQATVRRKSVGNTINRSGALRRVRKDDLRILADERGSDVTDSGFSLPEDVLETVNFRAVPLPMSLRRRFKDSLRARAPKRVSKWKMFQMRMAMGWKHFRAGVKEFLYLFEPWRSHLKDIEGQFGSGVVSYFLFLRWLMFLNLFVFLVEFGFVSLPTMISARARPTA